MLLAAPSAQAFPRAVCSSWETQQKRKLLGWSTECLKSDFPPVRKSIVFLAGEGRQKAGCNCCSCVPWGLLLLFTARDGFGAEKWAFLYQNAAQSAWCAHGFPLHHALLSWPRSCSGGAFLALQPAAFFTTRFLPWQQQLLSRACPKGRALNCLEDFNSRKGKLDAAGEQNDSHVFLSTDNVLKKRNLKVRYCSPMIHTHKCLSDNMKGTYRTTVPSSVFGSCSLL